MKFIFKLVFLFLTDLLVQVSAYFIASLFVDANKTYLFCFVFGSFWCRLGIIANDIARDNKTRKNKESSNGTEVR